MGNINLLSIKEDNDKIILMNKNIPSWISLTKDGYTLYKEIRENEIEKISTKYNYTIEEIKDYIDEIEMTLFPIESAQESNNSEPIHAVTIFLSNVCNFMCKHCFYSCSSQNESKDILQYDEYFKKFINNFVNQGGTDVTLTGGEPLLNKNFKEFVQFLKSKMLNIYLLTNGSLITDELCQFFADNNIQIQVSLDGDKNTFSSIRYGGNFERVLDSIKLLSKYNVKFDISFMPSKQNIISFKNILEISIKYKARNIHMPFFEEYGSGSINSKDLVLNSEELKIFLSNLIDDYFNGLRDKIKITYIESIMTALSNITRRKTCKVGKRIISLSANGDLYPCSEFIEDKFKIGSIYNNDSIEKIVTNNKVVNIFDSVTIDKIEKCKLCDYKYYCGGGCRLHSYIKYHDIYREDNYCDILQFSYEKILFKMA